MSTSNTHQQSLANAGYETRPPMLERGSYIPWASHFRRYLNRKRENRNWLNKAICEGPYEFRIFTPSETEAPMMQNEEDLRGDDLKHYNVKIEAMNLILISIPNDIYNSVDACTTAKSMWQRVERLMRGTVRNKVDRETRFNNEFDQFVVEPGEALVSVYNRFSQLMNDLERNGIIFSKETNNHLRTSSNTINQAIVQGDKVNIQRKNLGNDGRNIRRSYVQEEIIEGDNVQNDVAKIQRNLRTTSLETTANVQCYNYSEKGRYTCNCPKSRVRDSKYFMEQMLLAKQDEA
ncbi:hypothetical protein Tco_0174661 [Tanacetum coccineum]